MSVMWNYLFFCLFECVYVFSFFFLSLFLFAFFSPSFCIFCGFSNQKMRSISLLKRLGSRAEERNKHCSLVYYFVRHLSPLLSLFLTTPLREIENWKLKIAIEWKERKK